MKTKIFVLVIAFALLTMIGQTFAQPGRGLNQSAVTLAYNTETVTTIEGKITKMDTVTTNYGRFASLLIIVKSGDKEHLVYVSPNWYLDQEKIKLAKGKIIKITGSEITYLNKPHLIAREFDYEKKKYEVRKQDGSPIWAGMRMGPGQGRGRRAR